MSSIWGKEGPPKIGKVYQGRGRKRRVIKLEGGYVVYVPNGNMGPERLCMASTWRTWRNHAKETKEAT